jgi:hypothetical protein
VQIDVLRILGITVTVSMTASLDGTNVENPAVNSVYKRFINAICSEFGGLSEGL